ncbi:MAG TPA: type IVB secretion system protein IcmH/DotU, partial [Paracoccaceae bacterium]|nr:type IVB secretion system protein IcmH/DotU [Paracoccaceae bacterium]
MSGDPFDPFGQNERTIIRPQPGGRPAAPAQGAQQGTPIGASASATPIRAEVPVGRPIDKVQTPGSNPLLIAAGPLLDLLGRLRNAMTSARFADLKQSVGRYLEGFEQAATEAGADPAQLRPAKYALAATADDIVQNLPGEDRHVWTQDPMLGRYFGERIGGTRFFEYLEGAMKNPGANYDLLELQYACLALGFEGMHRSSPQGQSALQTIRRDVYQALRGVKIGGGWALSPHWQGMNIGQKRIGRQIPFWAVAAICGVLLVGLFFGLRISLSNESQRLSDKILAVHPDQEIEIIRASFTAPPPPPPQPVIEDHGQLERIRAALAPEIEAELIMADYLDANFIIVRMSNQLLFPSGKAEVGSDFDQLARRIGEVFAAESDLLHAKGTQHGRVVALGHSDAQPMSATARWSSNLELSKARAESVLNAILRYSPADLRSQVEGRGPN